MIDRKTGGVMHVDFGDCFEVAINRPKYPERVPFRLTRMLVSAMEVSGVHGTFSITCENTMSVLRNNSDSVMAVLEAFVHDPLIDWFTKSRPEGKCIAFCVGFASLLALRVSRKRL
jgi:FKBP12-rapamycin complex-associated protein